VTLVSHPLFFRDLNRRYFTDNTGTQQALPQVLG
ncbi:uncharacterized protein METZ01_LOCUS218044, partial [marine metagenome]